MSLTLKQILDAALDRTGFAKPTAYIGSTNANNAQVAALANEHLQHLRLYPWPALKKEGYITLTSDTEYSLPSDFGYLSPNTMHQQVRKVDLPVSDEDWMYLRTSGVGDYRYQARFAEGKLKILNPNVGDELKYQYISDFAVRDAAGDAKKRFTVDTDTTVLDDELMILGTLWRYRKLKGFQDWQSDLQKYAGYEAKLRSREGSSQTLNMASGRRHGPVPPYYDLWQD